MVELRTLGADVIAALGSGLEAADGDDGPLRKEGETIDVEIGSPLTKATLVEFLAGANPNLVVGVDVARYMAVPLAAAFAATVALRLDGKRVADGDDHDSDSLISTIACTGDCDITWANVIHSGLVRRQGVIVCTNVGGGTKDVDVVSTGTVVVVLAAGVTNPGIGTSADATLEFEYTILSTTLIRIDRIAASNMAPVITNAGTITAPSLGKIGSLHSVTGFAYSGTGSLTYQWERNGVPISGATSATYTPVADDDLTTLTRVTTVTGGAGSDSDETAGQAITYPVPVITNAGTIAASDLGKIGSPHSVTGFAFTGTGTVTYQWERSGTPISGATSETYVPLAADESTNLTRVTTVTNSGGADSDETAAQAITFAFKPSWVDNNGSGYLTFDGAAIGADSTSFDMFFLARSLDTNSPSATSVVFQNHGPRENVRFPSTGRLAVTLTDTAGTVLVEWQSTSAIDSAGEWLIHIAASLTGTPSFAVSRAQRVNGVMGAWEAVPGTFSTGPTNGTIDHARAFSGNDLSVFATLTGGSLCNCDLGFLWWSQGTPVADTAMANGGVLKDPLAVGSPVILVRGPAANLTNDEGSANITLVSNGTWTNS